MNPGSVFGSSFGQPQSSAFGNAVVSSGMPSAFGANPSTTSFGTVGSGSVFGSTPGTDSRSTAFGPNAGNVFGSPGSTGFGSGTSSTAFGTATSTTSGFAGTVGQTTGFGSGAVTSSGFGTPGFGTGLSSQSAAGGQFGSGINQGPTFGALVTASSLSGTSGSGVTSGTGSGFGGSTAFGTSTSGFEGNSLSMASSGFPTSTAGLSTGSSGFGTSASGFGQQPSAGGSVFGVSTSSGFGGGSSVFGSFTSAPGTVAQTQSNPLAGSSVFDSQTKASGNVGQSLSSGTAVGASNSSQPRSTSSFGATVFSTSPGFGAVGSSSVFGQVPVSTAVAVSGRTVFGGTNMGTSSAGNITLSSGSTSSTGGNVFGGGAPQTAKDKSDASFSVGNFSTSVPPPPSYSSSISLGQSGLPPSLSTSMGGSVFCNPPSVGTGSVFGGASKTAPGESSVFGGASKTASGESSVFAGASKTASGESRVFSGASKTASGESSVFGGASKTASGESSVFGGASKASSGQGSILGGAGRSVIKQESSHQSNPLRPAPAVGVTQPPPSVFGSSHLSGGTFPTQKAIKPASSSHHGTSSTSVFGGKTTFPSVFSGAAQQQGTDAAQKETGVSVFGGRQQNEKESSMRPPLFPAAANYGMAGSSEQSNIKQESQESGKAGMLASGAESTSAMSVFGGKQNFPKVEGVPGLSSTFGRTDSGSVQAQKRSATHHETGEVDFKRGRTEEQEGQEPLPTGSRWQGHSSPNSSPERVKLRRSSSLLEDVSARTSLSCRGIEPHLNKGTLLRSHFARYGKLKRVMPYPSKRCAVITFETHEAASRAKKHGTKLMGQDTPVTLFWRNVATEKSPEGPEETAASKQESKKISQRQQRFTSHLPSSVSAELASMSGADSDVVTVERRSRDRAEGGQRAAAKERLGSPHRREPAPGSSRGRTTPPPASATSSTTAMSSSSAAGLGKTTNVTVSGLRKMVSTTTLDKVNVLDIRDKLLRQKIGKQTAGGLLSRAFVGTCPDMCTEKERLYREEVRRLSVYEIIPGSSTLTGSTSLVDHRKAVKEYSRSSADQDEPLPHELRPLPVLTLTMNYLLMEIADCGEDGKWAEWYDFLWNRTRSIRKEITQQQLCSQEVVDLLEKCVRFHVYCAERLCAEDMMVFDSKINDENLTKCLQTLKELYADMEGKHGVFCPNEPEFRAYIVLMNLNEGDTLREVQQLRPEVRGSVEIGFAVRAYSALYSNNYVRFFRLVRSAPFLCACILHRYFNQIRAQALRIILKSHTAGSKKVRFSLMELQRLLFFEDEQEIREFCAYYGLRAMGGDLSLDRSAYVEPESSIPLWRAVGLVESKRLKSVGEVINGGPLQPVALPPPQCSFDEQGRFIGSLEGLQEGQENLDKVKPLPMKTERAGVVQQTVEGVASGFGTAPAGFDAAVAASRQAALPEEAADDSDSKQKTLIPTYSSELVKTIARDLFFEVIDLHVREMADSVIAAEKLTRQCAADIFFDVTSSAMSDLARDLSREALEEERVRQDQLVAAERREMEGRAVGQILESMVHSGVEEQAKEIALEEMEAAEARDKEERREHCTLMVQSEMVREVTREMAGEVAEEVYQVDVVARLQLLQDLQKAVELRRTVAWLALWRKALKLRQRQKRAMLDFPSAPPMVSARQRLKSMYPDRPDQASPLTQGKAALLVNDRALMTVLTPLESEQRSLELTAHLSLVSLLSSLRRKRAWEPLNLASLLRAPLTQATQQWPRRLGSELSMQNVQWKMLLSLPGEEEDDKNCAAAAGDDNDKDDDSLTGATSHSHHRLMPVLKQWLCDKFTHGDTGGDSAQDSTKRNLLSQYSVEVASGSTASPKVRVGICVRNVPEFGRRGKGKLPSKELGVTLTKGATAVLFLLPHADNTEETVWLGARLRLAKLLEAKPFLPATPLALLLPCRLGTPPGAFTAEVGRRLALQNLLDQDLVSGVAVVELAVRDGQLPEVAVTTPALQAQVSEAVKFLASKVPEPPQLRRERLGDVVEDMVNQHFFTPVLQDLRARLKLHKLHQAPNVLIGLYNSVVDHICLALTSPALQDISWPAPELQLSAGTREDWNSKKHLGDIYELVTSLRLPWFHYQDASSWEWSQVCHDVWTFVNAIVKKRCNSAVSLTSRVSRVLAHACMRFENECSLTQNEDHCTPTYVNAPWADVVVACAEFRLQRLHNWKVEEEEVGGDLEVLFEEEDMEEFEPPAPWIQALLDTENAESQRMSDTVEQASILHCANQPAVVQLDTFTTTSIYTKHLNTQKNNSAPSTTSLTEPHVNPVHKSDLPENIRTALEKSEKLLLHVGEERQKAQAFERYLQKALQGDASPDLNLSSIFSTPGTSTTPRVISTPALSSAVFTPCRPLTSGARASSSRERSAILSQMTGRNLEPRRLVEERSRRSTADGEGAERSGRGQDQSLTLCEGVEQFKENLQAQRYASELFEKRLKSLLES